MAKAFPNTGVTTGTSADRAVLSGMFEGQHFYETDTNKVLVYNGSSWVEVHDLDNTNAVPSGPVAAGIFIARGTSVATQHTSGAATYWSNLGSMSVKAVAGDIITLTSHWAWDGFNGYYEVYPVTLNASNAVINCLTTHTSTLMGDNRLYTVSYSTVNSSISYKVVSGDIVSGNVKVGYFHARAAGNAVNYLGGSGAAFSTQSSLVNHGPS